MADSSNLVKFRKMDHYKEYVMKSRRSYDVFVLLSAGKQVGCVVCSEWEDAYAEVAKAYKDQLKGEQNIVFAQVKYEEVGDVFKVYNMNFAPVLLYFAKNNEETSKADPKLMMNMANLETAFPDPIATFVSLKSGHKVEVFYSPWPKIVALGVGLAVLLVLGNRLALVLVPVLRRYKWFWFVVSIVLYGLGVSGSIFSYLRNVPNFGVDSKRNIQYFAGDRNQYGYEGIIIWAILVGGATCLVASSFRQFPHPKLGVFRPIISLFSLFMFAFLFRTYLGLYMNKTEWYRHGLQNPFTWPWIPMKG